MVGSANTSARILGLLIDHTQHLKVNRIGKQSASKGNSPGVIGCGGAFGRYRDCRIDERSLIRCRKTSLAQH
jgi:hypothetical protein